MPPKRARQRVAQPQVVQSDYDTDTAYHTDLPQTHTIPPPVRSNEELNLSVLQRHSPAVTQILSVAPFAVVYLFSPESQQWEKYGIEGTLFVCQLQPETIPGNPVVVERYSVVILNRKGLDNFATELYSASDVEITEQYVILQVMAEDGTPQIFGLWIFSEPEPASTAQSRVINAQIIQECATRAENSRMLAGKGDLETEEQYEEEEDEEEDKPLQQQQPLYGDHKVPPTAGQQINMGALFGQPQNNGHFSQAQPPSHAPNTNQGVMPQQYHQTQPQQYYSQPQPQQQYLHQPQQYQQQHPHQGFQHPQSHMYAMPQGDPRARNGPPAQSDVLLGLFQSARQGR